MTETDSTKRPLKMPNNFLPYLEKYRIYKLFKDMLSDLIIQMPKDHLKHMKIYLGLSQLNSSKDTDRIILLVEPELQLGKETLDLSKNHLDEIVIHASAGGDGNKNIVQICSIFPQLYNTQALVRLIIKDFGCFVITRRLVMDRYQLHDDYVSGCVSPVLMSEVTKLMTLRDPVAQTGWLMFDHPCTVREARCLQQDGVLPTVTLVLMATPVPAPATYNNHTTARNFFQQDFEGLKYAYKATLKEVHIDREDDLENISNKCFNAVRACAAGEQGAKQGFHVVGAPGVYRVLLLGPRGSGRRTQAYSLSKHFGLVNLYFPEIYRQAAEQDSELGERIRKLGTNSQLRSEVVQQRLLQQDCIDNGWVLAGYPICGSDFELLDSQPTPPNRVIFLNIDMATTKARVMTHGVDWCTGNIATIDSGPRVKRNPHNDETTLDNELDYYYSEALAELRAAAGISAEDVDATEPFDKVQVKIQAAVIAAPALDISFGSQLRNVCAD